jgi:hypothetical protein
VTARRTGLVERIVGTYSSTARRWRSRGGIPDRTDLSESLERNGVPRVVAAGIAAAGVGAALVAVGVVLPAHVQLGLLVAVALFLAGATVAAPMAVPVLAMPLLVVVQRIGGGGVDLSISDFTLFGIFWICVVLGQRPYSRAMRSLLWVSVAYQLATAFTVVANHDSAGVVEWFHAWLLVAGAVVVGWSIGRRGLAPAALSLLLGACGVIAVLALLRWRQQSAAGDSGPVYLDWPFGMHKNFIGTTLGFGAVVAYARPPWLRWPRPVAWGMFALLVAGIAVSQARQAYVGLAVGVLAVLVRRSSGVRHSPWILVPVAIALVVVALVLRDQIQADNPFNSAYQRLTWFQQAIAVWSTSPIVGVGLRWWYTGRFPYAFQPPNAEFEVLSSAGVVGLAGFVVLMVGSLVVLWRLRPDYGAVGFAVLLTRFVQGQFDLFWVAVAVSVPYLVAGMCLGAAALADEREQDARDEGRGRTPVRAAAPAAGALAVTS